MFVLIAVLLGSYLDPYPITVADMYHGEIGTIVVPLDLAPGSWVTLFLMKGDQPIAEISNTIVNYDTYIYRDIIPYTWSSGNDYRICIVNSLNSTYYSDYFTIHTSRNANVNITGELGLDRSYDDLEIRFSGIPSDSVIVTLLSDDNIVAMGLQETRKGRLSFNEMTFYEEMEFGREYHASLFDTHFNYYTSQPISFLPFNVQVSQTPGENEFLIRWNADDLPVSSGSPNFSIVSNGREVELSYENIRYSGGNSATISLPEQAINRSITICFCVAFESAEYGRIESERSLLVTKPNDFESYPDQVSLSSTYRGSIDYPGDVDFVRIPAVGAVSDNDVISVVFHGLTRDEIQMSSDWHYAPDNDQIRYTIDASERGSANGLFMVTSETEKAYSIDVEHQVDEYGENTIANQRNWRVDLAGYAIPDVYESGVYVAIAREIGIPGLSAIAGAMITSSENSVEMLHTSDISSPVTHILGGMDYQLRFNRIESRVGIQYRHQIGDFESAFSVDSLADDYFSSTLSANAVMGIKLSRQLFTGVNIQYCNIADEEKEGILCFGLLASIYL